MNKLDKYLIFSIVAMIIYTICEQVISIKTGVERSTLTTCFFAAFGGEVFTCGMVKIFNLKNETDNCAGATAQQDDLDYIDLEETEEAKG